MFLLLIYASINQIAWTGQTWAQTLQPTHLSGSMDRFFLSNWKTTAGQPVLVHFRQPIQVSSSTKIGFGESTSEFFKIPWCLLFQGAGPAGDDDGWFFHSKCPIERFFDFVELVGIDCATFWTPIARTSGSIAIASVISRLIV